MPEIKNIRNLDSFEKYLKTAYFLAMSEKTLMSNLMVNPLGFTDIEEFKKFYKSKYEKTK